MAGRRNPKNDKDDLFLSITEFFAQRKTHAFAWVFLLFGINRNSPLGDQVLTSPRAWWSRFRSRKREHSGRQTSGRHKPTWCRRYWYRWRGSWYRCWSWWLPSPHRWGRCSGWSSWQTPYAWCWNQRGRCHRCSRRWCRCCTGQQRNP